MKRMVKEILVAIVAVIVLISSLFLYYESKNLTNY